MVCGRGYLVCYPTERLGTDWISSNMRDFSDFIFSMGLLDLPLEGGNITWLNSRSKFKIDRFVVSTSLEDHFSKISQQRLPRILSDHFPIKLTCGFMQKRRCPFQFKNMWLKEEGFLDKVNQWWVSYSFHGSPSHILVQKLKALKLDLRRWNAETFDDVNLPKNHLLVSIQNLDEMEEVRHLLSGEKLTKDQLTNELEKVLLMDEISWRQKSRATWLWEGDKNTRFFHRVANSNCRFNTIGHLSVNGAVTTDQEEIGEGLVNFYSHLFSNDEVKRPLPDGLAFSSIDDADRAVLDRPFTEEEVMGVVKGMAGDKAPGPDGFSMVFFQSCWDIIKNDVMTVIHEFHAFGNFEKNINATFIALIPKKSGAMECKDFRPICLVMGVSKIFAKLLAIRLKMVLEKVVSTSQNAFIGGDKLLIWC